MLPSLATIHLACKIYLLRSARVVAKHQKGTLKMLNSLATIYLADTVNILHSSQVATIQQKSIFQDALFFGCKPPYRYFEKVLFCIFIDASFFGVYSSGRYCKYHAFCTRSCKASERCFQRLSILWLQFIWQVHSVHAGA